jgi:hypothetical protein
LELFRSLSGIRLRSPFGTHLERPESSFSALGELSCGRIGAHFLSSNRFCTQLISQLNSISQIGTTQRSTQLNSTPTSTQRSSFHQLNSQLNSTQLKIEVNSANYSTQLTSNQLTTQFNSTQLTTQRNSALN